MNRYLVIIILRATKINIFDPYGINVELQSKKF